MSKENGGPAFPQLRTDPWGSNHLTGGMSLRDWFAGQALAGLLANSGGPIQANGMTGWGLCNCRAEDVAGCAYELADAMLAERAKQ